MNIGTDGYLMAFAHASGGARRASARVLCLRRGARLLGTKPKDDMLKVGIDSANGAEGNAAAAAPEPVSKANHQLIGTISVVSVAKMVDNADVPALRAEYLVAVGCCEQAAKVAPSDVHGPSFGIGSDSVGRIRPVRQWAVPPVAAPG